MKVLLEKISRITFEIQIIYSRLTFLEVSKDIEEDYEQKKKQLLEELELLKQEEDKAYEPLSEDYTIVSAAIDTINHLRGPEVSEKMECCQRRIINRLQSIAFECGIDENSDDLMESFLEDEFFLKLYFDRNFNKDMLLIFIEKIYPATNRSLAHHYLGYIDLVLKNPKTIGIKRALINLKFDYLFQKGEDIETEFLKNGFNSPRISLSEDIDAINIPNESKFEYFDSKMTNIISYELLPILAAVTDVEMGLNEIMWFKTYILYLSDKAFNEIKEKITNYDFNSKGIKHILIKALNNINILKKIHNQDKSFYKK